MPYENQTDPSLSRKQSFCESNEQYAERMRRLDEREAMFRGLFSDESKLAWPASLDPP